MVDSIEKMARAMKLKTIAERVEDEQAQNILGEIGIDYAQGCHPGRPGRSGKVTGNS
jgi:EAL domain-containing protein (putative c-di-GMP-specific phosphodiesterase class I)